MNPQFKNWIESKNTLERSYEFYIKKKLLQKRPANTNLVSAHVEKTDHNLAFAYFLLTQDKFLDWTIVGLYYAAYHMSLALLAHQGFASKDHSATLCFLIKHFTQLSKEDITLIDTLAINKQDIEFYTRLREERKNASYTTQIHFGKENVQTIRTKTLSLITKMKGILELPKKESL